LFFFQTHLYLISNYFFTLFLFLLKEILEIKILSIDITYSMNAEIDKFITQELKKIPIFQSITLPINDNLVENLDTAIEECQKISKNLISKDGKIRQIFKDIKTNKLSKKQTNIEIAKIAKSIKQQINQKTDIKNENVKFLINNRINQILKNIIHNMIQF